MESRAEHWDEVPVWYDEKSGADKPEQSRDTESVMIALVLTLRDQAERLPRSQDAKIALATM